MNATDLSAALGVEHRFVPSQQIEHGAALDPATLVVAAGAFVDGRLKWVTVSGTSMTTPR